MLVSEQSHCSNSSLIYSLPYSFTKATKGSVKTEANAPKSLCMETCIWMLLKSNFSSSLARYTLLIHLLIYFFPGVCVCVWYVCLHVPMRVGACMRVHMHVCGLDVESQRLRWDIVLDCVCCWLNWTLLIWLLANQLALGNPLSSLLGF